MIYGYAENFLLNMQGLLFFYWQVERYSSKQFIFLYANELLILQEYHSVFVCVGIKSGMVEEQVGYYRHKGLLLCRSSYTSGPVVDSLDSRKRSCQLDDYECFK